VKKIKNSKKYQMNIIFANKKIFEKYFLQALKYDKKGHFCQPYFGGHGHSGR